MQKAGESMEEEYNYCLIPLTTDPNQQMQVKIPIDNQNISFLLTIRYNSIGQYWNIDIAEGNTGNLDCLYWQASIQQRMFWNSTAIYILVLCM